MRRAWIAAIGSIAGALLALPAPSASALTLGSTAFPSGATPTACSAGAFYVQSGTDSAYKYVVPEGGGAIDSWSVNTKEATEGTPLTLLLLSPSGGEYTVVGFDNETLPKPLPPSGIATFTPASPIPVSGGELLGLYGSATTVGCYFTGGSPAIPAAETIAAGAPVSPPSIGASYKQTASAGGLLVNVSADLSQGEDAGVTGASIPASITAGGVAEYAFTVTNGGAATGAITFTDAVPSGLGILSAVAGSGACTTAGQTVSCTISGLATGASTPVAIIVSAAAPGNYADAASVATSLQDPNPANNSAATTLVVNAPPAPPAPNCVVVRLAGTPLAVAEGVLTALNCKLGKVTSRSSKTVHKGIVIATNPGPSTLKAGSKVGVTISSGPPKAKGKKRHKSRRKKH